jgi:predicted dehydrogenase
MAKWRVGIVGCGRIASTVEDAGWATPASIAGAFAALPECELAAAANRGEEKLAAFGRRWGVSALYRDFHEMLRRERPEIVAIATPPGVHAEIVEAAVAAGARGIFCEKPMALSLAECDSMITACESAGIPLLVNCSRRWCGQHEAVRQLAEAEVLGPLLHLSLHVTGCKPRPEWEAEHEGPLLHDAVHFFDLARFFAGDAEWVQGTATRRLRTEFPVEDTSLGIIQFRSGVDAVFTVDELTEYERAGIELQFERGLVRLGFTPGLWTSQMEPFEQPWWYELVAGSLPEPTWRETPVHRAALDLVHCMESGASPRCSGRDGRAALELIMGIYESQRLGCEQVPLPLPGGPSSLQALRDAGQFQVPPTPPF